MMMQPVATPPPSPTRASLGRMKSSALAQERDEVQRHVQHEVQARRTLLARRSSSYLPTDDAGLRFATSAINTIYDIHQRYERRRAVDNAAFSVAMMGVVLVFIDNEYASSPSAKLAVRSANAALTLLLLTLVVWRFIIERQILIRRNVLPPHVSVFRTPKQIMLLLLELAVCAIFIPPGLDGSFEIWEWKYYMDNPDVKSSCHEPFVADDGSCYMVYAYSYEVLGLFSLLRLYMLPRVILSTSNFISYRTSYLGTLHHVDALSSLFAVKCFLRSHPFKMLLVGFLGTLLLTSYALAIVEAPVNPNLAPLSNAMWMVVLTMGTIGYGDLNAITLPGQVLLIFGGMLMGILLFGVLSSAVFSYLSPTERDRRFLYLLRRQAHQKRLRNACARSIQAAWKCSQARPGSAANSWLLARYNRRCSVLYSRLADQRRVRRETVEEFRSVTTELQRCQDQLLASLKEDHASTMIRLCAVEKRLDKLLHDVQKAVSEGK